MSGDKGHRDHDARCIEVRENLSAVFDGEAPSELSPRCLQHLVACGACREFEQRGALLTRQLRIRLLDPVPDLSRAILERLSTEPPPPLLIRAGRRRAIGTPRRLTRWAVAVVPLGLAFSGFASSAFANPRVVPTHPVTSCTAALARR